MCFLSLNVEPLLDRIFFIRYPFKRDEDEQPPYHASATSIRHKNCFPSTIRKIHNSEPASFSQLRSTYLKANQMPMAGRAAGFDASSEFTGTKIQVMANSLSTIPCIVWSNLSQT